MDGRDSRRRSDEGDSGTTKSGVKVKVTMCEYSYVASAHYHVAEADACECHRSWPRGRPGQNDSAGVRRSRPTLWSCEISNAVADLCPSLLGTSEPSGVEQSLPTQGIPSVWWSGWSRSTSYNIRSVSISV